MSLARTLEIARAELRFQIRRPLMLWMVAILFFLAWGLTTGVVQVDSGDSAVGGTKSWLTSQFAIAYLYSLLDFAVLPLFLAAVAGLAVLRDEESRTSDLLHSTPLTPGEYTAGKYLAVLAIHVWVMLLQIVFTILFLHAFAGAEIRERIGPFALANYVVPFAAFVLPGLVLTSGLCFAVGTLLRRPALVYLLPILLVVACSLFIWEPAPDTMGALTKQLLLWLDPSGWRWLNEVFHRVDRGVAFYNLRPIAFDATFAGSRLLHVALGLGAVAFTGWRFGRTLRGRAGSSRGAPAPVATSSAPQSSLAAIGMRSRPPSFVGSFLEIARTEAGAVLKHPALWLFVPLFALLIVSNQVYERGPLDAPLLLTPGIAAVSAVFTLSLFLSLLLMFFMVEALNREKTLRLDGIHSATPVRTSAILFAKVVAAASVGVAVLLATLIGDAIAILVQGKLAFSVKPFLLTWGLILVPSWIVFCAFVAAVFAITRNRFVTYGVALGAVALTVWRDVIARKMSWVTNWAMARSLRWSDLGAFELDRVALAWNRALMLAAAVLFGLIAVRFLPRRESDAVRTLHRLRPKPLLRTLAFLSPALVVVLVLGFRLHAMVQSGWQGDATERDAKDYWRKNVKTWTGARRPDIVHVDLDLALDPARRTLASKGRFDFVNAEDEPLARFALTGGDHWQDVNWTLDGKKYQPEDRARLFVFTLAKPLARGEGCSVGFEFHGEFPRGATKNGGGADEFVLESGVVLSGFPPSMVPAVGFVDDVGVDEDNRADAKEYPDDFCRGDTRSAFGSGTPFTTHVVLHGPPAYRMHSVGTLVSDEVAGDVRTMTWDSDYPVRMFNVVAGRLDERKGHGTAIYHYPGHTVNLDEMIDALDGARRWYSEWFFPFPWAELKVTEFPGIASYAQGFATNITFSESIGFLVDSDARGSVAFMVIAHESAHQWWGNLLTPGEGPGGNILSEGMAHFATILLHEQMKGIHTRIEFCKRIERFYNDRRRADSERPLVKTDGSKEGDTTVTYDKGGWVFWMLLDLIGRENDLKGCQALLKKFMTSRDHAVLQDFIETMRGFAPDVAAYDAFVKQWFYEVVVPQFEWRDVSKRADGAAWKVNATLANIGTGRVKIEVAAIAGKRFDDDGKPDPSYREAKVAFEIGAGEAKPVAIDCDFEPERLVVDPDALVLMIGRAAAERKL